MTEFEKAVFETLLLNYPIAVEKTKTAYFEYLSTNKYRHYDAAKYAWRKARTGIDWTSIQARWREEFIKSALRQHPLGKFRI